MSAPASQTQLAALTGMRPGDVSRYERGVREPRLSSLVLSRACWA